MCMPEAKVGDMDEGIRAARARHTFGSCAGDNKNWQPRKGRICQGETMAEEIGASPGGNLGPRLGWVISHMEKNETHRRLPRDGCSELKHEVFTNSLSWAEKA